MSEDQPPQAEPSRLSEDAAHQLLARAIELDHSRGTGTTVAALREVAREVGISDQAFDLALREVAVEVPPVGTRSGLGVLERPWKMVSRVWLRLRGNTTDRASIGESILSSAIAVTLFYYMVSFLARITSGGGWQALEATILFSGVLGIGIARRLRARPVEIGLMGLVAYQAAELATHLLFGIRAVQGGPTHIAVMVAGTLGAVIGLTAGRRPNPVQPVAGLKSEPVLTDRSPDASPESSSRAVELRHLAESAVLRGA